MFLRQWENKFAWFSPPVGGEKIYLTLSKFFRWKKFMCLKNTTETAMASYMALSPPAVQNLVRLIQW